AECGVLVARLPIAGRLHTRQQRPVVQDRQVEPRAVPGNEAWRELLDAIEEPLDQLTFRSPHITQAPDSQSFAAAQHAGDGHDPMLLVCEELTARSLPAQGKHSFRDLP